MAEAGKAAVSGAGNLGNFSSRAEEVSFCPEAFYC
jgi:hypothetical protein